MARNINPLYIGNEYITKFGSNLKHEALIKVRANVNINKISDTPLQVISMDIETNAKTGELKLLGVYNEGNYMHYTENFINVLFGLLMYAYNKRASLCYWNRLDPFVIFRTLLMGIDFRNHEECLARYGKVGAEWDYQNNKWKVSPVISITTNRGEFGICQVIRSSIQFYILLENDEKPRKVWAYDIAQLYQNSLEKECLGEFDKETQTYPKARFSWYSKVDKSAHIVDWDKFDTDKHYRENIVLKSNMLDARACSELAYSIQEDFAKAFYGNYPRSLISQGVFARASIVATIQDFYKSEDPENQKRLILDDLKSIGIYNFYDKWVEEFGADNIKDLMCLITEAYSGGYIETIHYGYADKGCHADIASAYPGIISELLDLRNCVIKKGIGEPPRYKDAYVFIRGDVNIPQSLNYNPITVKSPIFKDTNIRCSGEYKASYILEERDFLIENGATFENEEWYAIITEGHLSPLAKVCLNFIDLRKKLKAEGNSAEYMAKVSTASIYGILYEAVDTFEEHQEEVEVILEEHQEHPYKEKLKPYLKGIDIRGLEKDLKYYFGTDYNKIKTMWASKSGGIKPDVLRMELETVGMYLDGDHPADILNTINDLYRMKDYSKESIMENKTVVTRAGYRSGEFWNPIYATIITAKTRIKMARACLEIEKAGGVPIVLMTDSITWKGTPDMLPKEMVRDIKTLGYFETPQEVTDIVCLGSGRYGFKSADGSLYTKRRGLNAVDITGPTGMVLESLNWHKVLTMMAETNKSEISINTKTLISVGMVYHSAGAFTVNHLGRIIERPMEINAIVGTSKRIVDEFEPEDLIKGLVSTKPFKYFKGIFGNYEQLDQTFPELRNRLMGLEYVTKKERKKISDKRKTRKYYEKNKEDIQAEYRAKYDLLKEKGYEPKDVKRYVHWSRSRLEMEGII